MIVSITNEIVDKLESKLEDVVVLREYPDTRAELPCIIIEEGDLPADISTMDSGGYRHVNYSINLEIYTEGTARIKNSYEIRNKVDKILSKDFGLGRTYSKSIPNMDINVYRYKMVFNGKLDENKTIYRG